MKGDKRVVVVICDSLRSDLVAPGDTPFLVELSGRGTRFANHRSVFPSTTRASSASIATGCLPARHGLYGNTMALDEGDGLVCRNVGAPDFRDRMRRATGRTLRVPVLAERLRWHGETAIVCSNVSPGAAYFQDPDGHGIVYHAAGSYGPGLAEIDDPASAVLKKGIAGDRAMTDRFCADIVEGRAPALAVMWLSEPDYTGHHSPLGSLQHREAIAAADRCVRQVFETVRRLDPAGDDILFITGSDHGMETVTEAIDITGLLVAAGLKEAPDSRDVVLAPQGTSATIFFSEGARGRAPAAADFLRRENWAGRVIAGAELPQVGLPGDGALQVAVAMATDDRVNPHGISGHGAIVANPEDNESKVGFGQHGGLGINEQNPFLIVEGGEFAPRRDNRPTSLIDIAPTVLRHLRMDHDDMDGEALPLFAE
ncbi:MAG TPA: alkaline phosphatase family protein [Stellaceae bacterium]|nr:alkaline phosphatase family protein [Stellaceae bacterium]